MILNGKSTSSSSTNSNSNSSANLKVVKLNTGDIIFNEGDPSDGLYLIQEGTIEVFQIREGLDVILGVLKAGDIIGTLTILSKEPRTASVRAGSAAIVVFYPNDKIQSAFKSIPTWIKAIVKDAITRIKSVNERLIEAKVKEKNLMRSVGSQFHHTAQLAYLLAALTRKGKINTDGDVEIFQTKDFLIQAEFILMKRYSYLEKIFHTFSEYGLIKVIEDKRYGNSIVKPNPQLYEDFAVFCIQSIKKGTQNFVPKRCHNWMSSLLRISKKNNNQEDFRREDLALLLQTDLGREDGESLLEQLIQHNVISDKFNSLHFTPTALQRTIVFESIVSAVKNIVM